MTAEYRPVEYGKDYDVVNNPDKFQLYIDGKELTVPTKKNPERKLQTETHTVIGKAAGDFQNQQKIQKNDREQRLAGIYYNRGRNAGCKPEH